MLDRNTFIERMEKLKTESENINKLYNAGVTIDFLTEYDNAIDIAFCCLEELMEDDSSTIFFYVYECDWGREGENKIFINDESIPFTTLDDLYNVMITVPEPEETKTVLVNINYGWETGNRTVTMDMNKYFGDASIKKEIKHWIDSQVTFDYEVLE